MANDMTWEQKCRISALRAACASPFDPIFDPALVDRGYDEVDEEYTKRILARAEAFRIALLADGALDYEPGEEELTESNVCPMCGSNVRKMRMTVARSGAYEEWCSHKWHQE